VSPQNASSPNVSNRNVFRSFLDEVSRIRLNDTVEVDGSFGLDFLLWLIIANGNPHMVAIAAIRNTFDIRCTLFMILPPQPRSAGIASPLQFPSKKYFRVLVTLLMAATL
jgi:hypothetical protein